MLFHLRRVPDSNGLVRHEWLDILAFEPIAIVGNHGELESWARQLVVCDMHCRTPDGFVTMIGSSALKFAGDLEAAQKAGYEYYMADKPD